MNLLLALALLLQDGSPEESYRRIEETLQKARTLKIEYQVDVAIGAQKMGLSGVVLQKEGNKLKITAVAGAGLQKQEASAVSDGTTVRSLPPSPGSTVTDWAAPKDLNEKVTVALMRRGCFELHRLPARIRDFDNDPKAKLLVSDLRRGDDDAGMGTLVYTLQEGTGRAEVKLWFDPKTHLARKRVCTLAAGERQLAAIVTETYTAVTVDADLPDDAFKRTDK